MKVAVKICITIMALVAILSMFQWLQVICLQGGAVKTAYNYNIDYVKGQRKIKLDFKVVDQFMDPVPNYALKVAVISVKWYWWIFPGTRLKMRYYFIKTNEGGIAHFEPKDKGCIVEPLEVDNSKYQAIQCDSKLLWPEVDFNAENKIVSSIKLDHPVVLLKKNQIASEPIELKVIKHDISEKLVWLDSGEVKASIDISENAPDDLIAYVSLGEKDERGEYQKYWLKLKVIVNGAKKYAIAKQAKNAIKQEMPSLTLQIEGEEGIELREAHTCKENISYAPKDGYRKLIIVNSEKPCFVKNTKMGNPIYYVLLPYYMPIKRDILFHFHCGFNAKGSLNLFEGKYPPQTKSRYAWLALE